MQTANRHAVRVCVAVSALAVVLAAHFDPLARPLPDPPAFADTGSPTTPAAPAPSPGGHPGASPEPPAEVPSSPGGDPGVSPERPTETPARPDVQQAEPQTVPPASQPQAPEAAPPEPEAFSDDELYAKLVATGVGARIAEFTDCPDGPECRRARNGAGYVASGVERHGADPTIQRIYAEAAFFASLTDGDGYLAFPAVAAALPLITDLAKRGADGSVQGRKDALMARRLMADLVRVELEEREQRE